MPMISDQITRLTDPEEVDKHQAKKFEIPIQGLIRKSHTLMVENGGGGGPESIPYWYPAAGKMKNSIDRRRPTYDRHDPVYKRLLQYIPYCKIGLEIQSDIGRSTGFLLSKTQDIDVIDDAIEWVDIYDGQARNIARRLGRTSKATITWHYGTEFLTKQYDWIKIEFDRVDRNIKQAIQHCKPGGKVFVFGTIEQCRDWLEQPWAKGLEYQTETNRYGTGKNSFICFSINTNGETHD